MNRRSSEAEIQVKGRMSIYAWISRPWIAFAISLAALLPIQLADVANNEWFYRPPKPVGDGLDYENIAFHVAQGTGYRIDNSDRQWRSIYEADMANYDRNMRLPVRDMVATGRPPLFPTAIAAIYRVVGRNSAAFSAVRCFSAFCLAFAGALAVWMTAYFFNRGFETDGAIDSASDRVSNASTQKHHLPHIAACIAIACTFALSASNRTLQSYANDFLTEPLALAMTQVFIVITLLWSTRVRDSRGYAYLLVAGIILGLMILTRSIFVVWLPGIWILICLAPERSIRRRLSNASLVMLTAIIVCIPWWSRNVSVLDRWMPLGTQGPITLLGGYSDAALAAGGEWQAAPEQMLRSALADNVDFLSVETDTEREVIVSRYAGREVRDWIYQHQTDLPSMAMGRVVTHWNPYSGPSLVWKLSAVVGIIALFFGCERRKLARASFQVWMIGMPLLSTLVAAALYSTGGRFLIPMYGILFSLAGIGVGWAVLRTGTGKMGG